MADFPPIVEQAARCQELAHRMKETGMEDQLEPFVSRIEEIADGIESAMDPGLEASFAEQLERVADEMAAVLEGGA